MELTQADPAGNVKEENKVVEELEKINPLEMTPIEAINKLFELKGMLKK